MRAVHLRPSSIVAAALFNLAGSVSAQDEPTSVLNSLEVRQLSRSFIGNPGRNLGTGMSAYCKRLADLNTQSATTLRELAAYAEPPNRRDREAFLSSVSASRRHGVENGNIAAPVSPKRPFVTTGSLGLTRNAAKGHGCSRDAPWSRGAVMNSTLNPGRSSAGPDVTARLR